MRVHALFAVVALGGCDRVFGIGDPNIDGGRVDAGGDASTVFRKTITISAPGSMPLTDFPVSVLIDTDAEIAMHASTANQISFVDTNGTHLGCEIVSYDNNLGALDAWVLVPSVPASPGTLTIDLVYGDGVTPCGGAEAWPTAARGIWHNNLAFDRTLDSTSHGNDQLTIMARGIPTKAAGIVGEALSFDGDDTLCTEDATGDGSLDVGTASFTVNLWLNERTELDTYDTPFSAPGTGGYAIFTGVAPWSVEFSDGVAASQLPMQTETLGAWINITIVIDRAAQLMRPYRDGVQGTSYSIATVGSMTSDFPTCESENFIDGTLDEVQLYSGALSPSWIQASYTNIANRTQMIAIGPEH